MSAEFQNLEQDIAAQQERQAEVIQQADGAAYPMTDQQVIGLLDSIDYRVGLETIHRYLSARYIECPGMQAGRRQWEPLDVVRLKDALEFRRQWKPFSRFHDAKKSLYERLREQAEASGNPNPFRDLERYSLEDLLLYWREADTQPLRDMLHAAVKIKLEANE